MEEPLTMVERETENTMIGIRQQWQWQVIYARCFTVPVSSSSSLSESAISSPPSLLPLKRSRFMPIWISTAGSSTVSLHPSADGSSSDDSILTVSLQGTVIEEHFISKLNFSWPQVSCMSGFPARGSLVVFASYKDSADKKQKFALRFSEISETEDFINSLEDILSSKLPDEQLPSVEVISAISSQSELVPPYRPDTSNVRSPTCISPIPYPLNEDLQESQAINGARGTDTESNIVAFPPRFTSLVSNCSADIENGNLALALALPDGSKEFNLKAQIAKYMQDASFLEMVDKVNEVISELGEYFAL